LRKFRVGTNLSCYINTQELPNQPNLDILTQIDETMLKLEIKTKSQA